MIRTEDATLLESGGSVVVGTVDGDGMPDASRCWLLRVAPGGDRLRCLLPAHDRRTLANLEGGGRIAVCFTHVFTLDSVQVKGRALALGEPTAEELEASARYREEFFANVEASDATPRALLDRMVPAGFVAVDVEVVDTFDQTPGPNAGERR